MSPVDRPGLAEAAADVVRAASRRQRLATCGDVLEGLGALGLLGAAEGAAGGPDSGANEGAQVLALLPGLLAQHPDLACFGGLSGQTLYHAPELLWMRPQFPPRKQNETADQHKERNHVHHRHDGQIVRPPHQDGNREREQ